MYQKKENVNVEINSIKSHPKNPKIHHDELIYDLIRDLGYASNIVIDENNTILAGHGRVKALKKKGDTQVEAIRITGWTEEEKERFLLADNKSTILAGFDENLLKNFSEELRLKSGFNITEINVHSIVGDLMENVFSEAMNREGNLFSMTFVFDKKYEETFKEMMKKNKKEFYTNYLIEKICQDAEAK